MDADFLVSEFLDVNRGIQDVINMGSRIFLKKCENTFTSSLNIGVKVMKKTFAGPIASWAAAMEKTGGEDGAAAQEAAAEADERSAARRGLRSRR